MKIETLRDITKYEKYSKGEGKKKATKGVPIILKNKDGELITTDYWLYVDHNDELVFNIRKNIWCQGSEFYDVGKSHIKEIYVVQAN